MRNLNNAGHASWLVESSAEVYSSDGQEASQQSTDEPAQQTERVERSREKLALVMVWEVLVSGDQERSIATLLATRKFRSRAKRLLNRIDNENACIIDDLPCAYII